MRVVFAREWKPFPFGAAWLLHAEGRHDEALAAMHAAAEAEDRTEKHVVTPGPLAPARELYGAMLVERGLLRQALAAFEATLEKEPNRLSTTLAAAKAAEKAGDRARAQKHYAKAVSVADGSGNSRTEIVNAHAFMRKYAK
jgi:tetratricopeptide (TPR) repeat protein